MCHVPWKWGFRSSDATSSGFQKLKIVQEFSPCENNRQEGMRMYRPGASKRCSDRSLQMLFLWRSFQLMRKEPAEPKATEKLEGGNKEKRHCRSWMQVNGAWWRLLHSHSHKHTPHVFIYLRAFNANVHVHTLTRTYEQLRSPSVTSFAHSVKRQTKGLS